MENDSHISCPICSQQKPTPVVKRWPCKRCGQYGHKAKTCGRINGPIKNAPIPIFKPEVEKTERKTPTDPRSVREQVMEMWEGGLDQEETIDALPELCPREVRAVYRDLERKRND